MLFRGLTEDEAVGFREWAQKNWKPGEPIEALWHPVVRDECLKILYSTPGVSPQAITSSLTHLIIDYINNNPFEAERILKLVMNKESEEVIKTLSSSNGQDTSLSS